MYNESNHVKVQENDMMRHYLIQHTNECKLSFEIWCKITFKLVLEIQKHFTEK